MDGWAENAQTRDGAPGVTDAGTAGSHVRMVGRFSSQQSGNTGPFSVQGGEIAACLRDDTDGLATFVNVRVTGESAPSGAGARLCVEGSPYGPTSEVACALRIV